MVFFSLFFFFWYVVKTLLLNTHTVLLFLPPWRAKVSEKHKCRRFLIVLVWLWSKQELWVMNSKGTGMSQGEMTSPGQGHLSQTDAGTPQVLQQPSSPGMHGSPGGSVAGNQGSRHLGGVKITSPFPLTPSWPWAFPSIMNVGNKPQQHKQCPGVGHQ